MATTYTPIATQILTSATASVTFSGIPSTYTDLILVSNASNVSTDANLYMQFNTDTATNYSSTRLSGDGSTVTTTSSVNTNYIVAGRASATGSSNGNAIAHIMSYSNINVNKNVLTRSNNSSSIAGVYIGCWRNTAIITSITIFTSSAQNLSSNSSFSLYGIKAA